MPAPVINLTGKIFGRLTVLERDLTKPMGAGKSAYWICQCECGKIKSVRTDKLRNGETRSCGCLQQEIRGKSNIINLENQIFGRLKVIKRDETKPMGKNCPVYWLCQCQCGNMTSVRSDHLRDGTTSSCGCLNSIGEEKISNILQSLNVTYKTQYEFEDLKGDFNNLRFDFAIFDNGQVKYLIEYQGKQHYEKWGNETLDRFNKRLEYDQKKKEYCKKHNLILIEIPYTDLNNLNKDYIRNFLTFL